MIIRVIFVLEFLGLLLGLLGLAIFLNAYNEHCGVEDHTLSLHDALPIWLLGLLGLLVVIKRGDYYLWCDLDIGY